MLKLLKEIAREAGQIILSAEDILQKTQQKDSARNLVTEYDVQVQAQIRTRLLTAYPEAEFIGEEGDAQGDALHGLSFIVDPIDGTANFTKNYRCSAICIAAAQNGEIVCGVVFDPYTNSLYSAVRNQGAFLNDTLIHVASGEHALLENGLFCMGTASFYPETYDRTFRLMRGLFDTAMDFRRSGSAAIDLCCVACGRAVLMVELGLYPWDFAAASLIVTEAGGMIRTISDDAPPLDRRTSILAATPEAFAEFFAREMDKL